MRTEHARDIPARRQAQQRADDIRVFHTELARLEAEGVLALGEEQRQVLATHHEVLLTDFACAYDIDRNRRAKQLSLGMRVASFLGALASLGLTIWLQGCDASGYSCKLAALITFAAFVLNITMIGQIFNITPPDKALLP